MSKSIDIDGDLVTRVEGHGTVVVDATDGELDTCEWQVVESPRFFESMLDGRTYEKAHHVVSRICAICSVSHTLASLRATESALEIDVSERDRSLRRLALFGETIQSHVLHVGYLALPDLVGSKSALDLPAENDDDLERVVRLHRLGNDLTEAIAGRSIHAQRMLPGGFSAIPDREELESLRERLSTAWADLDAIGALLGDVAGELPTFERETEYISLSSEDHYPFVEGTLYSSDTGELDAANYRDVVNERVVDHSTAKFTSHARDSYMVGALARYNNNHEQLAPEALDLAAHLGLDPPTYNPYLNTVAQVVETAHLVAASIRTIDDLLDAGLGDQPAYHVPSVEPRAGQGVGAIEVPRGVLFHDYEYDAEGAVTNANCVIPTNQNHGNIQRDMETFVPRIADRSDEEIEHVLEMLVRAYDPCISCSTHYLDIDIQRK
ncbi:MAG: Ni/Fe hydrogenase subunit alpha [Halococcoides sp.]